MNLNIETSRVKAAAASDESSARMLFEAPHSSGRVRRGDFTSRSFPFRLLHVLLGGFSRSRSFWKWRGMRKWTHSG